MTLLAAVDTAHGVPPILCTILLIATIIAFILGLAEALGFYSLPGGAQRFSSIVVAVILLVVYVVLC
jgi:hypothetical protein